MDDPDITTTCIEQMRRRGSVAIIAVNDPFELKLPPPASYPVTDDTQRTSFDTQLSAVADGRAAILRPRRLLLENLAARGRVKCASVSTGLDLYECLGRRGLAFLQSNSRRKSATPR
jgi:hypothetical protein